jgi:hypothetical protein
MTITHIICRCQRFSKHALWTTVESLMVEVDLGRRRPPAGGRISGVGDWPLR